MNNRNMWKHGNAMRSASSHTKEYKEVLMKNFTKKAAVAFCAVSMGNHQNDSGKRIMNVD